MIQIQDIVIHLAEAAAISIAIYIVTKREMDISSFVKLVVSISLTFIVLDVLSPRVSAGARQGSGFGLGFMQFAGDGNFYPEEYYEQNEEPQEL